MKVIIQRVSSASVTIDDRIYNAIDKGYVLLVGFTNSDTIEIVEKIAKKIVDLRIFEDSQGKLNLSIEEVKGEILSISQFTLYADCKKGKRPSFTKAAGEAIALPLYDYFNECLSKSISVKTGVFGSDMEVKIINDGPVTITLDSEELIK